MTAFDPRDPAFVAHIYQLRRSGRIDRAVQRIAEARQRKGLHARAMSAIDQAEAGVAVDLGDYGRAAGALRRVYEADQSNPWVSASALELECRDELLRARRQSAVQRRYLDEVDRELRNARGSRRAAYSYVKAQMLRGLHPDFEPDETHFDEADALLDEAEALVGAGDPLSSNTIQIGRVRLARARLVGARNPQRAIDRVRTSLDAARARVGQVEATRVVQYDHVTEALDYETARILILERKMDGAIELLDDLIERRPGYQAARVWRIHVLRFSGWRTRRELITIIDDALGGATVRVAELRAELFTQKAGLLREQHEHDEAMAQYQHAIDIRPAMTAAVRGLAYCHFDRGGYRTAERLLHDLADLHRPRVPAELRVDLGRMHQLAGNEDAAHRAYLAAMHHRPAYGVAYEARLRLLTWQRRHELADKMVPAAKRLHAQGVEGVQLEWISARLLRGEFDTAHDRDRRGQFLAALRAVEDVLEHTQSGRSRRHAAALLARMHFEARSFRKCSTVAQRYELDPDLVEMGALAAAELGAYRASWRSLNSMHGRLKSQRLVGAAARVARSLARMWRALGQPTKATSFLEAEIARLGEVEEANGLQPFKLALARLHVEYGWALLDLSDPARSLESFNQALHYNPLNLSAVRGRTVAIGYLHEDAAAEVIEARLRRDHHRGEPAHVTAALRTEMGRVLIRRGVMSRGFELFESANGLSHNFVQRTVQIATLIENGMLTVAAAQWRRTCEISPVYARDPAMLLLGGWLAFQQRDLKRAEGHYKSIRDSEPAMLGRAAVCIERGEYRTARRLLGPLVDSEPTNAVAQELVMWTLIREHERRLRISAKRDATLLDSARQACARLRHLEPDNLSTTVGMGFIAAHSGALDDAAIYLNNAVSLAAGREADRTGFVRPAGRGAQPNPPIGVSIGQRRLAGACRDLGALYVQGGFLTEAAQALDDALAHDPFDARACLLKGVVLDRQGNGEAMDWLRRAFALDPSDTDTSSALALALARKEQYADGLAVLREGLDHIPSRHQYRLHLARARLLDAWALKSDKRVRHQLLALALDDVNKAEAAFHCRRRDDRYEAQRLEVLYHESIVEQHRRRTARARALIAECVAAEEPQESHIRAHARMQRPSSFWDLVTRLRADVIGLICGVMGGVLALVYLAIYVNDLLRARGPVGGVVLANRPVLVLVIGLLLAAAVVLGGLHRLRSVKLFSSIEVSFDVGASINERIEVDLEFGEIPLVTISGPTAHRPVPYLPDTDVESML